MGHAEDAHRLEAHDRPGDVPGLQGGGGSVGERAEWWPSNWSPTARRLVGSAGAVLLVAGTGRRGEARRGWPSARSARGSSSVPLATYRSGIGPGRSAGRGAAAGRRPSEAGIPPVGATRPMTGTIPVRPPGP